MDAKTNTIFIASNLHLLRFPKERGFAPTATLSKNKEKKSLLFKQEQNLETAQ
jgi:hypothetical protein